MTLLRPCSNISVRQILPWDNGEKDDDKAQKNKMSFLSGTVLHTIAWVALQSSPVGLNSSSSLRDDQSERPAAAEQAPLQRCWAASCKR